MLDLLGNFVHTSLIGNYSILLKMTISLTSLFLKSTYALNVCGVGEAAPADAKFFFDSFYFNIFFSLTLKRIILMALGKDLISCSLISY